MSRWILICLGLVFLSGCGSSSPTLQTGRGVYWAWSPERLENDGYPGSGPEKYVVALGYAGWGEGQLENEMLANAWLSVPADTDIVFDLPLPSRFDEALGRLGIKIDRLHSEAGHA